MVKLRRGSSLILYLSITLALVILTIFSSDAYTYNCPAVGPSEHVVEASHQKYTIMRPTLNEASNWIESYKTAPSVNLTDKVRNMASANGAHFTLLDHMNYTPSERDQGTCGNCWAWAGTGILEIALDSQLKIKDRLSIQYINSNYNGGTGSNWSCCGGWLQDLAKFYDRRKMVVSWSNTNAQWQDGRRSCGAKSSVSGNSISTNHHYDLTSVQTVTIPTWGLKKEEAISSIKNVLNQGKGVWFGFFLPNQTAWNKFFDFWGYQPDCTIWQFSNYTSQYNFTDGGSHSVLCVGYNDTDPKKRYWIMLNSWGVTKGRPDGLFMVDMDMDYNCTYSGFGKAYYWMTLDVNYVKPGTAREDAVLRGLKKLVPMHPMRSLISHRILNLEVR